MTRAESTTAGGTSSNAAEVFRVFLRLGLTSFGGPIAHLGYLRHEFVLRRAWLDEDHFAQLLAVCQFLPGPASSQMGFAIGLSRGGWRGALAAFLGFTLPSALLMFGFAAAAPYLGSGLGTAAIHGLKLVAVVVVAHGVLGMVRQHAADMPRALIAASALVLIALTGNAWMQLAAIALGGLAGLLLRRRIAVPVPAVFPIRYGRRITALCLGVFLGGLIAALAWPASDAPSLPALAAAFYRAGALVFGGGHVVLPLLQQSVVDPGWVGQDAFLAGYGAAQAVPGPMFTLAAYLGAEVPLGLPAAIGAAVALLAVFLPGFLLLAAVLPMWGWLTRHVLAASVMAGINAAVVGLLAAALYDPAWTQGVRGAVDLMVAVIGFALLVFGRLSAIWIVAWCVAASCIAYLAGAA